MELQVLSSLLVSQHPAPTKVSTCKLLVQRFIIISSSSSSDVEEDQSLQLVSRLLSVTDWALVLDRYQSLRLQFLSIIHHQLARRFPAAYHHLVQSTGSWQHSIESIDYDALAADEQQFAATLLGITSVLGTVLHCLLLSQQQQQSAESMVQFVVREMNRIPTLPSPLPTELALSCMHLLEQQLAVLLPRIWTARRLVEFAVDAIASLDDKSMPHCPKFIHLLKLLFQQQQQQQQQQEQQDSLRQHALLRLFVTLLAVPVPSPVLSNVLLHVPVQLATQKTAEAFSPSSTVPEDCLQRCVVRVLEWPQMPVVTTWALACLNALVSTRRLSILYAVSQQCCVGLAQQLSIAALAAGAVAALEFLLLGYQHSPDVFHSVLPTLVQLLRNNTTTTAMTTTTTSATTATTSSSNSNSSSDSETATAGKLTDNVCGRLVQLLQCCMRSHPGYPELYLPAVELLQQYPQFLLKEDQLTAVLYRHAWTVSRDVQLVVVAGSRAANTPAGLYNLGNTCYANVFLQLLFHCRRFRHFLLHYSLHGAELHHSMPATLQLQRLFYLLQWSSRVAVRPTALLQLSHQQLHMDTQQQDTTEFGRFLLNRVADEFSHVQAEERSPIKSLFEGQLVTKLQCRQCNAVSTVPSSFLDLDLYLDRENSSLEYLLKRMCDAEVLTGSDAVLCSRCNNEKRDTSRWTQLTCTPRYLLCNLNRMQYDVALHRRTKLFTHITFPFTQLDLSPFCCETSAAASHMYSLVGILIHSGASADHGHYYAYVRERRSGWWLLNDSRVSPTNETAIVDTLAKFSNDVPYLLLYEKQQQEQHEQYGQQQEQQEDMEAEEEEEITSEQDAYVKAEDEKSMRELQGELQREEEQRRRAALLQQTARYTVLHSWNGGDDADGGGNGMGPAAGGGGGGSRFVC